MRLIDADALDEVVLNLNTNRDFGITRGDYKLIDSVLFEFPTIERKTGKWKKLSGSWFHDDVQCSECGNTLDMNGVNAGRGDANFCPNCGAYMRGEQE